MIGRGVFEGVAGAYPRALYRSMGFVDADFEKPLIGIANSWSEVDPGHFHLRTLAEWVKEGVREAGGAPAEFNTVAPCDGIAQGQGMHAILPLRDVIAASVELMALANRFDGLVMLCSCDKIVPGMLIAAARLNLPTIFVLGGPMAPGQMGVPASFDSARHTTPGSAQDASTEATAGTASARNDTKHPERSGGAVSATQSKDAPGARELILSDVKEAMGRYKAGHITEDEFYEIERCACPSPGACGFMGTANTMACIVETLGLTLPGCATLPALDPAREELCRATGRRIVDLVRENVRAGAMLTQASLENAVRVTLALGGSTNATLHLPAVAHEVGVEITPDTFDRLGRTTPLIAKFAPASRLTVVDLHAAGGVPAVLNVLSPLLAGGAPTVDGRTVGQIAEQARVLRDDVLHPLDAPLAPEGGIVVLRGTLAPDGAVVKQSAVAPAMLRHIGPARVFESEEEVRDSLTARTIHARRRAGDPQRGTGGRAGDARALDPGRDAGGHGAGRIGGDDHRRALLGRHARPVHRPCLPGGIRGRPDCRRARGRPDRDRRAGPAPRSVGAGRGACAPLRRVAAPPARGHHRLSRAIQPHRRAGQPRRNPG